MKSLTSHVLESVNINEGYESGILRQIFAKDKIFHKSFQTALTSDKAMAYSGTHKMYSRGGGDLTIKKSANFGFLAIDAITDDMLEKITVKDALKQKNGKGGEDYIRIWLLPDGLPAFATWGNYLIDTNFKFSDKNIYGTDKAGRWMSRGSKYEQGNDFRPNSAIGNSANTEMLMANDTFKSWVLEFVDTVYQIAISDMQYAAVKRQERQSLKQDDINTAKAAEEQRKKNKSILSIRNSCAAALKSSKNNTNREYGRHSECPILPCGVVNVKTGENKYFNILDENQIDGVMYVFNSDSGKLKYVLSSGVLFQKTKHWVFIHDQTHRYLFEGEIVDILPVPDFITKYKSGTMYVFK